MTEDECMREVRYMDNLSTQQRRDYLHEAEKARGVEVAYRLRAALIAFWKSVK